MPIALWSPTSTWTDFSWIPGLSFCQKERLNSALYWGRELRLAKTTQPPKHFAFLSYTIYWHCINWILVYNKFVSGKCNLQLLPVRAACDDDIWVSASFQKANRRLNSSVCPIRIDGVVDVRGFATESAQCYLSFDGDLSYNVLVPLISRLACNKEHWTSGKPTSIPQISLGN